MKKVFVLLFLIIPLISTSQIEITEIVENEKVGEIVMFNLFLIELQYNTETENYIFLFRDGNYQAIIEIKSFIIAKSDIDTFYNTILKYIPNKEKKELEVKLTNGDKLTLNFKKKKVQFLLWNGVAFAVSSYFSERQIKKLFNR